MPWNSVLYFLVLQIFPKLTYSLSCHECYEDDCWAPKLVECDEKRVATNMLGLKQIFRDIPSKGSKEYSCLLLDYAEIAPKTGSLSEKKLHQCVESDANICKYSTKDDIQIINCVQCYTTACDSNTRLKNSAGVKCHSDSFELFLRIILYFRVLIRA